MKNSKLLYAVVAFLLACGLWAYVVLNENPKAEISFVGPVVTIKGEETLRERDLMVTSGDDTRIALRIKGLYQQMAFFDKANVTASADISYIREAGSYNVSNIVIDLPDVSVPNASNATISTANVTLTSKNPSSIAVVVENVITRDVPVVVSVQGDPAENYLYDTPVCNVETIQVTGAESAVSAIDHAEFPLTADGLDVDYIFTGDVKFVDAEGAEVAKDFVEYTTSDLEVILPVQKIVSVPLHVSLKDSTMLTADMVTTQINPETVRIVGDPEAVDRIEFIYLGRIDLADMGLTYEQDMEVVAPTDTYLYDPVSYAHVELAVEDIVTRDISVSHLTVIDSSASKYTIQAQETPVKVGVKGEAGAVNALSASDLYVSVIINAEQLGEGTHTVSATTKLLKSGYYYLTDETVNIKVTLTAPETEEDPEADNPEEPDPNEQTTAPAEDPEDTQQTTTDDQTVTEET